MICELQLKKAVKKNVNSILFKASLAVSQNILKLMIWNFEGWKKYFGNVCFSVDVSHDI